MSKTTRTVLWIILIVIVIALIVWMYSNQSLTNTTNKESNSAAVIEATTLSRGNSDADLDQDFAKIDTQMRGLDNDYNAANQNP
ncbi:MAG TPA: hypothetical protein VFA52_01135 [Candidatus Paceibacterota bacterium]|nr:hypothetical protein [Candidatus Paceibacterota bacterium]